MRAAWLIILIAGLAAIARPAQYCNPTDLTGPYGFQLTGDTTISGDAQPVANLGRVTFDGSGGLSGVSSVAFSGVFLGNPVTGSYEAHRDCTVTWSLQDDSGGFQHFSGTMSADGGKIDFSQTDPGGAQNGRLVRTADECRESDLRRKYQFELSGSSAPAVAGGPRIPVEAKGVMEPDAAGNIRLVEKEKAPAGTEVTVNLESGCIVNLQFMLGDQLINLRGILVNQGREMLAVQTDPGVTVSAKFTAAQ
jgi:hypothetical protein